MRVLDGQRIGFAIRATSRFGIERASPSAAHGDDHRTGRGHPHCRHAAGDGRLDIYQPGLEDRRSRTVAPSRWRWSRPLDRSTRASRTPQDELQRRGGHDGHRDDARRAGVVPRELLRRDDKRGRDTERRAADRLSRRGRTAPSRARPGEHRHARRATGHREARREALPHAEDPGRARPVDAMSLLGGSPRSSRPTTSSRAARCSREGRERVARTSADDRRRRASQGWTPHAPFDGEGSPRRRGPSSTGVLRGYLTNLKTARKLSTAPTGNARRGSYASPSRIDRRTSTSKPARTTRVRSSAVSTSSRGNFAPQPAHHRSGVGEFSLGATGTYLERVRRCTRCRASRRGQSDALLSSISGVGTDLTFGSGGHRQPHAGHRRTVGGWDMMSWQSLLHDDPVPWLLEKGDPAVRAAHLAARPRRGPRDSEFREASSARCRAHHSRRFFVSRSRTGAGRARICTGRNSIHALVEPLARRIRRRPGRSARSARGATSARRPRLSRPRRNERVFDQTTAPRASLEPRPIRLARRLRHRRATRATGAAPGPRLEEIRRGVLINGDQPCAWGYARLVWGLAALPERRARVK